MQRTIAPPIFPFPQLAIPKYDTLILDNGIECHYLDNGDQEVTRVVFGFEGGLHDSSNPAVLTIMSQLLCEGFEEMSGETIAEQLDYNGAWLKAEPSLHILTITIYALNKNFAELLPIMKGILTTAAFPENAFLSVREKLAATAELNFHRVSFVAFNEDKRLIFGEDHPCARVMTPDEIRKVSREEVIECYRKTILGNKFKIFLAGRINSTLPLLADMVRDLEVADHDFVNIGIKPFEVSSKRVSRVEMPQSMQSAIFMSVPTIPRSNPDYISLRLAVMALGGYFGSRLMQNIREDKGYTYGITASLFGYREGSVMSVHCQADPAYIDSLIDEVKKEISRMQQTPPDEEELAALKSFAMSQLASHLDSPFTIMDMHMTSWQHNIPADYFERQYAAIEALTSEEISRLLSEHIDIDEMRISIAGK